MTGNDRFHTPKAKPMPHKRSALAASLDIGTIKIACMIARLKPCPPNDALRGRSHAVELIGYSQIQARGVKAAADIHGGAVTAADVSRVTSTGMRHATAEGRTVLHTLPVGYALDGVKGIRDPRGM